MERAERELMRDGGEGKTVPSNSKRWCWEGMNSLWLGEKEHAINTLRQVKETRWSWRNSLIIQRLYRASQSFRVHSIVAQEGIGADAREIM